MHPISKNMAESDAGKTHCIEADFKIESSYN